VQVQARAGQDADVVQHDRVRQQVDREHRVDHRAPEREPRAARQRLELLPEPPEPHEHDERDGDQRQHRQDQQQQRQLGVHPTTVPC
jgi:hypothetical protein